MNKKKNRTKSHHYVPQWYQKRFIDPQVHPKKLRYLDLSPDRVDHSDGTFHVRRALSLNGPAECFETDHLYTLRFAGFSTDDLETRFFGAIDNYGQRAADFFANYEYGDGAHDNFNAMLQYLDAQKWRTPKGLDYLRRTIQEDNHQLALLALGNAFRLHCTIWTECVWEVLACDYSPTKFIVSDHPVTTYNKGLFPASPACTYPMDAPIEALGTHTFFPLNLNRCLVLTNLGYVRNPGVNPTKIRVNPRYFEQTMFDLRKVQTGRQIDEKYVLTINHVIKSRARRFIAAAREEWLYPETHMKLVNWNKLGGRFFLMPDPRKVQFTTGFMMGFNDGRAWNSDEYGRRMSREKKDPHIQKLRSQELRTFEAAKRAWDSEFGKLSIDEKRRYW